MGVVGWGLDVAVRAFDIRYWTRLFMQLKFSQYKWLLCDRTGTL